MLNLFGKTECFEVRNEGEKSRITNNDSVI